jgi:hypothetical protein
MMRAFRIMVTCVPAAILAFTVSAQSIQSKAEPSFCDIASANGAFAIQQRFFWNVSRSSITEQVLGQFRDNDWFPDEEQMHFLKKVIETSFTFEAPPDYRSLTVLQESYRREVLIDCDAKWGSRQ